MKITFILPFAGITGGIKHYLTLSNGLVDLGHEVNIFYPGKLFPNQNFRWKIERVFRSLKYWLESWLGKEEVSKWFDLKAKIKKIPDLSSRYICDADVVIATANETADWVVNYPASKGDKFYYVLDYEIWARDKKAVEKTFTMPLKKIALGNWQKEMLEQKFHQKVYGVVPSGVDTNKFVPVKKIDNQSPRILMLYHELKYKGIDDGIFAYKKAKQKFPDIKLVMFGVHPLPDEIKKLNPEFHYRLEEEKIPAIYQSCDIFIWPSHHEGFGLPPLEAMACGLAVITTNTGSVADFTNKDSAIVVPPEKPDQIAGELIKLLSDKKQIKCLGDRAAIKAKSFSWPLQVKKLEKIIIDNSIKS